MLRLSCALVVVASVGAAPPIPGSTKATWSMDILRRVRIVECGLAVAKSMGGASYRTTPALQTEWARRLDFDEADFEAITRVGGAGACCGPSRRSDRTSSATPGSRRSAARTPICAC
jgi:hypothetical protein